MSVVSVFVESGMTKVGNIKNLEDCVTMLEDVDIRIQRLKVKIEQSIKMLQN